MRYRRAVVLLSVMGVLAAACGNGETTDTTAATDTTVAEAPDTTEATSDLSEFEFTPGHACFFSAHHLFVPEGEGDGAVTLLADAGIISKNGYIGDPVEDPELDGDPDPNIALEDGVDIVTIADGSPNALMVSEYLRSNGIAARPVHLIAMAGHWQVKPGNDPEAADENLLQPGDAPDGSRLIAVVDTAMVETSYGWVLDGVDADHVVGQDPHDLGASHGTFISSLIRQVTPDVTVAFASLPAMDKNLYFQSWPDGQLGSFTPTNVTSEIPAYEAILDLIPRLTDGAVEPSALSLSWGTYPCDSDIQMGEPVLGEMIALAATIDMWQASFPEAPIFAAAGNEPPDHGPFFPAADADVVGVAADGGNGMALVWDDATPVTATLDWANIFAPGCDLIGVSGVDEPGPVVAWGGSSFATPLAALTWMDSGMPPSAAATMPTAGMLKGPVSPTPRC